jgi:NhaP-type Na+/H+ or K+/H+ antiporter
MYLFKLLVSVLIIGVIMGLARGWFGTRFTTRSNVWGGGAMVLTIVCFLLLFTPLKWLAALAFVAALPLAVVSALLRSTEEKKKSQRE